MEYGLTTGSAGVGYSRQDPVALQRQIPRVDIFAPSERSIHTESTKLSSPEQELALTSWKG
jgi:hypothetical protein